MCEDCINERLIIRRPYSLMLPFREVRVLDINSEHLGVSIDSLMENAGEAVAEAIVKEFGAEKKVAIVCGVGNNAGDGFVAARNLLRYCDVTVLLASPPAEIRTENAKRAYERIKHVAFSSVGANFSNFDIVIDALLGTGNLTEVREPYRTLIKRINAADTTIVSIDVPSGLHTDLAIKPQYTVTFTDVKEGMTPENSGEIIVMDIGVPRDAYHAVGPGEFIYYPKNRPDSHKGENGKVLIVGGGPYTGAPALAGMGALRIGADLVHIATPNASYIPIASYSPDLIVHRLSQDVLCPEDVERIVEIMESVDAVLIGPGLGKDERTQEAVRMIITKCNKPMVIDADAITAISSDLSVLNGKECILTPHAREFKVLTGESVSQEAAIAAAKELDCVLIVKGKEDIITNGKWTKINHTGNSRMSVGGTGDVLAGEAVAMLSKEISPFNAARIAAFTNGAAGDLAFESLEYGFTATDVIDKIPEVLRRYLRRI
ncbi:NAD(P)H-hydrate dehydratase [Candidatus Methanomassiliicoccus intestinalis]|uniref:NAD(P)H-hydrate dehydratase n=1 Tax=Candidatus Methanomassiliicoccus intestinalis TaxID=1406512 RepID=UPI0037DDB697